METKQLYNNKYFVGSKRFQSNKDRLDSIIIEIEKYSPKRILDVGCGIGFLVKELLKRGYDATGVDFASCLESGFWGGNKHFIVVDAKSLPFNGKEFDVVVSSDFLEHIPEEDIDTVVWQMKRVGKTVLARVAYEDTLTKRQGMYHVTNKPKSWWEAKLRGVILI